jgi:hypothetical protein
MLHMLRAGSGNQAEQCGRCLSLARYLLMMKILTGYCCVFMLTGFGAQAFAQTDVAPAPSAAEASSAARPQAAEPLKTPGHKDLRAKRGTDLRLALVPKNSNANSNTSAAAKPLGGLSNVSDVSTADFSPEHHLNAKERQEMRELLRQQRLKQQQN